MDFYLDNQNAVNRLVKEWKEHGKIIIAYDFDNTVYDYHKEGHSYEQVISLLQECKEFGAYCVVFTAKADEEFPEMIQYLDENQIPYDAINDNVPVVSFNGRKIYYNILLDDRAGLKASYDILKETLHKVRYDRAMEKWTKKWKTHIETGRLKLLLNHEEIYHELLSFSIKGITIHARYDGDIALLLEDERGGKYILSKRSVYDLTTGTGQEIQTYFLNKKYRYDTLEPHHSFEKGSEVSGSVFSLLDGFPWDEAAKFYDKKTT